MQINNFWFVLFYISSNKEALKASSVSVFKWGIKICFGYIHNITWLHVNCYRLIPLTHPPIQPPKHYLCGYAFLAHRVDNRWARKGYPHDVMLRGLNWWMGRWNQRSTLITDSVSDDFLIHWEVAPDLRVSITQRNVVRIKASELGVIYL